MMSPHTKTIARGILFLLAIAAFFGCATTGMKYTAHPHTTFKGALRAGMSPGDVRMIAGSPPETLALRFGENTDEPWDAFVMVYWGPQDPQYVDNDQPVRHKLVFAVAGADTVLDHWELMETAIE